MDGELHAPSLSRRLLTRTAGATAVATAVSAALAEPAAAAATTYTPRVYWKTKILERRALHVVQRFTGGWTPAIASNIAQAGGIDAWFAKQLTPWKVTDTFYNASLSWWASNTLTAAQLWERDQNDIEGVWQANANYQRWSAVRRIHADRHVVEAMAAFWEHHFNVPANGDAAGLFRAHYGRVIRANALGRFDTLLQAVITHPSMGCYLGNAQSTKSAPNENLGRELLELHTVSRHAGYDEDDVKNSARILTGYRVDTWRTWDATYQPNSHWTGPVSVLGFSHPNADPDGRAVTAAYLSYLAHHPSTAKHLARKLAVRFVSDAPSDALVARLAKAYLDNDTAITPVLKVLVASEEFRTSYRSKVRTPDEDVVATYRALGTKLAKPTSGDSAANALLWQCESIGQSPFTWPRPDGRPDTADAWNSVSRLLSSWDTHYGMSGRWWPSKGVTYRTPAGWLPEERIRFDYFVDHLCRRILGFGSTATLLKAACQATGVSPSTVITKDHGLIQWEMPRLLTALLDSPFHLTR